MKVKKNIINNFVSRVCFVGSAFLVNLCFSHLLGAATSGQLYYVINNYAVAALLSSLSLESGMTFFLSRKEVDDRELISFSLVWTVIASVIAALLLFFLKSDLQSMVNGNTSLYSFILIAGTLLTTYFSALFFGRQQFVFPLIVPAITNLAIAAYCGWLFFFNQDNNNKDFVVRLYFISFIANGIILTVMYVTKYAISFSFKRPSAETLKRLLNYSSIAFAANIISFFAYRIDYWILKGFMPVIVTANAFGNYVQVSKLVQIFLFVPTVVATIVFPVSASGSTQEFEKEIKRMIGWLLVINLLLCFILLVAGKWAFPFLFGNDFSAMYMCFVFSIPAIIAITVVRVMASYFAGKNLVKYNLAGGFVALVIVVMLNYLLVPFMGINGAALADSAGYLAFMFFLLFRFNKEKHKTV